MGWNSCHFECRFCLSRERQETPRGVDGTVSGPVRGVDMGSRWCLCREFFTCRNTVFLYTTKTWLIRHISLFGKTHTYILESQMSSRVEQSGAQDGGGVLDGRCGCGREVVRQHEGAREQRRNQAVGKRRRRGEDLRRSEGVE